MQTRGHTINTQLASVHKQYVSLLVRQTEVFADLQLPIFSVGCKQKRLSLAWYIQAKTFAFQNSYKSGVCVY